MNKSENRLVQIYDELRSLGYVTTQREFASLLGIHFSTLSSALSGAVSQKLVATAERVRREILDNDKSPAPAPAPTRKVEELSPAEMLRIIGGMAETIQSQQAVIDRLTGGEQQKKGAV